jgi:hypothetical protein
MRLRRLPRPLWDQGPAIANARAASVELSRARVEREEVELFVARHVARRGAARSA